MFHYIHKLRPNLDFFQRPCVYARCFLMIFYIYRYIAFSTSLKCKCNFICISLIYKASSKIGYHHDKFKEIKIFDFLEITFYIIFNMLALSLIAVIILFKQITVIQLENLNI